MASATSVTTALRQPLILDFDQSVSALASAHTLDLSRWQEQLRFSCSHGQMQDFSRWLEPLLPAHYGCVFLGSGDYHHLSLLLLQRLPADKPIQLIICDNHPDNMRYPLGIHCGSWVYWASHLPQVSRIHVLGITSADIGWRHAVENHWGPLRRGKITYWSCGVNTGWLNWLGARHSNRAFADADQLLQAFLAQLGPEPVYLSIDKDVLSKEVVQTNWDQGIFREQHLQALIAACSGRVVGADITGEVSIYHYRSRLKRFLSACDGQETPSEAQIIAWQQQQNQLNQRLLQALEGGWGE
ncbi:MAG: arginase family protein [Enterobacteriaceae bacterium]